MVPTIVYPGAGCVVAAAPTQLAIPGSSLIDVAFNGVARFGVWYTFSTTGGKMVSTTIAGCGRPCSTGTLTGGVTVLGDSGVDIENVVSDCPSNSIGVTAGFARTCWILISSSIV